MSDFLIYGVCALLIVGAVAVTSIVKIIVKKVAEKNGKELSGTFKEYIFTPLSVSLASVSVYFWLKCGCSIDNSVFLKLFSALAGAVAPIIYLLLFQSTRKIAVRILNWIRSKIDVKKAAEVVISAAKDKEVDIGDIAGVVNTEESGKGQDTAGSASSFEDLVAQITKNK